jgi:hypothetical protein
MQVQSAGASTYLLRGSAWSMCGHSFSVECIRRGTAHGSTCGHSQGALRGSAWKHMRPPAWRGVHAVRGGCACAVTTQREGLVLGVCERTEDLCIVCGSFAVEPIFPPSHVIELHMFHVFHMYISSGCSICCNGYIRMLQVYVLNVSSISDVCCKVFYLDVVYV